MDLKTFLKQLPIHLRKDFAARAHTSDAMLSKVANGHKQIELGFADVIVALSGGVVTLGELPLTDRARFQRDTRDQHGDRRRAVRRQSFRRRADRE
jgi:hypothetical protein